MGRSYSSDLRDRVVSFVGAGGSRRAAARHFGASNSFAVKLLQRTQRFFSSAPAAQGRPPGKGKLAPYIAPFSSAWWTSKATSPCRSLQHGLPPSMAFALCRRRHVDDVRILGVEGDDLHRLVEADEQRADDGGAAEFLQHLGRDRGRVERRHDQHIGPARQAAERMAAS